jgi:DNA-directed RNA polymerase specialized sigma24 family protein
MSMNSEIGFVSSNAYVLSNNKPVPVVVAAHRRAERFKVRSRSADWIVDQSAFDQLLCWLDRNPEAAGHQYELIRRKLIRIFSYKGCVFPEELADETFNRVTRKLPDIRTHFTGSPVKYFYGVAKKVYLEYLRKASCPPPPPVAEEYSEELLQHLDDALGKLTSEERKLILDYYGGGEQSQIDYRKKLAERMGVHVRVLRMRAFRIRERLKKELAPLAS